MKVTVAGFFLKAIELSLVSPRKHLADEVFDGDFFDVNVAHGEFVEQRLADGDHAVAPQ